MSVNKTNRLFYLDYLRGTAAFGIMVYHFLTWTKGQYSADTFMGRVGMYGVSIFYVLSGLTLYHVYYKQMNFSKKDIFSFFKKRIYRIYPLLWFVTIISIILSRELPNFLNLALNLTGIFGFVKWDVCFSPGVWSIGNELTFYALFPFLVFFSRSYKYIMAIVVMTFFLIFLYFSFLKLNPDVSLGDQWRDYINPLNQVFYFVAGFFIGYFLENVKIKNSIILLVLIFSIVVFVFYPAIGDRISIVTGFNRLYLSLVCILLCACFYKLSIQLPSIIHKPFKALGDASYSVYLLHPIVYVITIGFQKYIYYPSSENNKVMVLIIYTLITSVLFYEYFEKYFINKAKVKQEN